ncbi:MAG: hypothetical protein AAF432_00400 [Planctomycetota bacterium]
MSMNPVVGTPGIKSGSEAVQRIVRKSDQGVRWANGYQIIDGANARDTGNTGDTDVLRAGMVMGKITSGGKYAPSFLGALAALHDTAVVTTTMTVPAAVAAEIVRRIGSSGTFKITGPPTAAGTVATETVTFSAVNTSTGAITITATSADFVAGSFIQPTDGSETPKCLVDDGYGIQVTDHDNLDTDVEFPKPLIGGMLDSSQIIDWPSDTSLQAWLVGQLNADGLGTFTFDHLL